MYEFVWIHLEKTIPDNCLNCLKGINDIGRRSHYTKLLLALGVPKIEILSHFSHGFLTTWLNDTPARNVNIDLLTIHWWVQGTLLAS
jgi:hypothetical protein